MLSAESGRKWQLGHYRYLTNMVQVVLERFDMYLGGRVEHLCLLLCTQMQTNMFCKVNDVFISTVLSCCCMPLLSIFSRSALQTIICSTFYMFIWSWHPIAWLPCLCWLATCNALMSGHFSRISWNQMPVRNVSSMEMASSEATFLGCKFVVLYLWDLIKLP